MRDSKNKRKRQQTINEETDTASTVENAAAEPAPLEVPEQTMDSAPAQDFTTPSPNTPINSSAPVPSYNNAPQIGDDVPKDFSGRNKIQGNTKITKALDLVDRFFPDDKSDAVLQAERKYALRAPAALIDTAQSAKDVRQRGQRLFFERSDGQTKDGAFRKGLDAAYIATQAASQVTPDQDQHEDSGTTAARKFFHGSADLIKMLATAEKKQKTDAPEQTPEIAAAPEVPRENPADNSAAMPSKRDIEQYKRVQSRRAAIQGKPPVRAAPKDMTKDEMRETIRETNSEIREQKRPAQATRNDVRRQKKTERTARRTSYHRKQNGNTSSATAPPKSTQPATPKADAVPAITPPMQSPPQPAATSKRKISGKRKRQKKPQPQAPPVPISPLQHGTPPSLPDESRRRNEKGKKSKPEKPPGTNASNLKHGEKTDKNNKLNFNDNQQSNTFLAQGGRYIRGKAVDKIHSEISKDEKEFGNTGIESAHKAVTETEKAHGGIKKVKKLHHHAKTRHIRRANKAKAKALRHEGKLARQAVSKNPAYKGKPVAKAMQKMRIKRQYAKAMKAAKAGKTVATAAKGAAATAKSAALAANMIALKVKAIAAAKALILLLGKVLLAVLLIVILLVLVVSCVGMVGGGFTAIMDGLSYQADMDELTEYSVYFTQLEVEVKEEIIEAATDVSGLHEFRLVVENPGNSVEVVFTGTQTSPGLGFPFNTPPVYAPPSFNPLDLLPFLTVIQHCPFEIMAYLTAVYGDFSEHDINEILREVFEAAFEVQITEGSETRTATVEAWHYDFFGNRIPPYTETMTYNWFYREIVLTVHSTVRGVLEGRMNESQREHFDYLMETLGLRQFVASPFEENWLGAISSNFGYRFHPVTTERHMHTGIDIAKPEGTPILGGVNGTVILAQDNGGYGLTVIIEYIDEETGTGVQVLYAHLATIDVSVGDVLEVGAVIGTVGQTGVATGPHLHLEILITEDSGESWRRVNPAFFVEPY